MNETTELPIIQKMYDLIIWATPLINKFPRDFKFTLGDRMQCTLYTILEGLIYARYARDKIARLEQLNAQLDVLRYQTRIARDLKLWSDKRYAYANVLINEAGKHLGGWLRQQRRKA